MFKMTSKRTKGNEARRLKVEMGKMLLSSAKKGDIAGTKALLSKGANVNYKKGSNFSALQWAAKYGHMEMATLLLDGGALPDMRAHNGEPALHKAAERGQIQMASLLLDRGASLHATSTYGDRTLT